MDLLNDFEAAAELLAAAAYFLLLAGCWFPCGGCGPTCTCECQNCSAGAPCSFTVVVAHTAGTFSFVATQQGAGSCLWRLVHLGSDSCTSGYIGDVRVDAVNIGGIDLVRLQVSVNYDNNPSGFGNLVFQDFFDPSPDCCAWAAQDVPYAGSLSYGSCNDPTATCSVTANQG